MLPSGIHHPPVGFHFAVAFDFSNPGGLKEFLKSDIPPENFRFKTVKGAKVSMGGTTSDLGGENTSVYSLPTKVDSGTLSLSRGMISGSALMLWIRRAVEDFKFTTCGINVILLNNLHLPVAAWRYEDCYPSSYSISDFDAMDTKNLVIESLEFKYKRVRIMVIEDFIPDAPGPVGEKLGPNTVPRIVRKTIENLL